MVTTTVEPDAAVIRQSWQDSDCFAVLYDRYAAQLYRYAYRRMGPQAAEDVVADTFVAAFQQRHRYDVTRSDARPWFFGILSREISHRRRSEEARYRALARAADGAGDGGLVDSPADRVAAEVTARAARPELAAALAKLSTADRDVLLLFAWGSLTYEEIATALAIPVGTVRSRLNRARGRMRSALGGADPTKLDEE